MTDINRVVLVGRLTRDAELRYTASGVAVCNFSIAVNRRRKNGDAWEDEASFFDIALWGKQGETLNQYLVKGKQVCVEGELRQSRWEQDGQTRSKVEIVASNLQLLGGNTGTNTYRQNAGDGQSYSRPANQAYPNTQQQNTSYQKPQQPQGPNNYEADSDLDNVPF